MPTKMPVKRRACRRAYLTSEWVARRCHRSSAREWRERCFLRLGPAGVRGPVPLSTSKKPKKPSVDKSHFCSEKSWHQRRKSARRALNRGGCSWGVLLSDPRRPPEVHLASSTRATLCECCVEGAGAALNVVQAWGLE